MLNNRILIFDLYRKTFRTEKIKGEIISSFLGGRGINMYLLYKYRFGPDAVLFDDPLIIGAGMLAGLPAPCMARGNISGLSPETGLLGDSNIGGFFMASLRMSGFGHIVITGRSNMPVYISIQETISICDASTLWGLNTQDTQKRLRAKHGNGCQVLTIGKAGEEQIPYSAVVHNKKSAAARTGMGCLMGGKKLKAIIVKPAGRVNIHDRRAFISLSNSLYKKLEASGFAKLLGEYGTPFLFKLHNRHGIVRSYQSSSSQFDHAGGLDIRVLKKYYKKAFGCFACSIKCHHTYFVMDNGELREGEGPEYGTLSAFGPICGNKDLESVLILNNRVNDLGLDSVTTGNLIAFLIENFEYVKDLSDFGIKWGDTSKIIKILDQIVNRRGLGSVLSEGYKGLFRYFPQKAIERLPAVKGLIQSDGVDVRAMKGFALGIATSSRGADHLRSRPTLEMMNVHKQLFASIYENNIIDRDPASYDAKVRMVRKDENEYAVGDSVGICRFVQRFNTTDYIGIDDISRLIKYGTGYDLSEKDLFLCAERIVTLERFIINKLGITSKDDRLPLLYLQPVKNGPKKGSRINRHEFDKMLKKYYGLRKWDPDGTVPESLLLDLGIRT